MRLSWVIACGLASYDCANRAVGLAPQIIFNTDLLWIWWVPALFWCATAIRTAMGERG